MLQQAAAPTQAMLIDSSVTARRRPLVDVVTGWTGHFRLAAAKSRLNSHDVAGADAFAKEDLAAPAIRAAARRACRRPLPASSKTCRLGGGHRSTATGDSDLATTNRQQPPRIGVSPPRRDCQTNRSGLLRFLHPRRDTQSRSLAHAAPSARTGYCGVATARELKAAGWDKHRISASRPACDCAPPSGLVCSRAIASAISRQAPRSSLPPAALL